MDDPAAQNTLLDTRLRVATWNLWWRFGPWEQRLPLIIEELTRIDADVIALQEVWATDETDAAAVIAKALGYHSVCAAHVELEPGVRFGNGLLSRWPITSHEMRDLPATWGDDEHRNVLRADVDGPRGSIEVYTTHLNWRIDHSAARQQQVRAIADFVSESTTRTYPAVLCGDFNAEPHSEEMMMLTGQRAVPVDGLVFVDTWHALHPDDPGYTFDNVNPFVASQLEWNRRLDYVLAGWPKALGAGNPVASALFGTAPTSGLWPSDHFGVVSELRY